MSTDIPGSKNWREEVGEALKNARFGILCITTDNLASQWLLFEAGTLYFNGTPVFPLAIDLDELRKIPSPLIDVQAQRPDERGIKDLVFSINEALGHPQSDKALERTFKSKWKKLERELDNVLKVTPVDYEKTLQDFMGVIISINDYRLSLDFSPVVDVALELFADQKREVKTIVETAVRLSYELIEEEREKFARESVLVGNIRDFFREYFDDGDLRDIIIRLSLILCSESPNDEKREQLLVQIKKEESDIYIRYHRELVEKLRNHLP